MDRDYKILGQAAPLANTDTTLVTVGAGSSAIMSVLLVTNQSTTGDPVEIRVAIVPSGETLSAKHYIAFGALIDVRETIPLPIGAIGMAAGTSVIVRTSAATVSFTASGVVNNVT